MPLWHPNWDSRKNTKEWYLDCFQVQSSGDNYLSCPFCVSPVTLHGNMRNACTTRRHTITFKKSRSTISRITDLGWSNFKRQSARSAKYNACGSSVAMPSRKQMSRRQECCKRTIPQEREAGMEKWRVRDRGGHEGDLRCLGSLSVYATVFKCGDLRNGSLLWCSSGLG